MKNARLREKVDWLSESKKQAIEQGCEFRDERDALQARIDGAVRGWRVSENAEPQIDCPLTRAPVVRHSKRTAERDLKNYVQGKIEPVLILRDESEG